MANQNSCSPPGYEFSPKTFHFLSGLLVGAKTTAVKCMNDPVDAHTRARCVHISPQRRTPGRRLHIVGTESDGSETCTISSIPLGKDRRQRFLFIRLPAIWNQISPEDTMKLQIFSVPVYLPTKAHRINITTLSLSSCYKLPRWWHFDQACVSPQAPLQVHTHHMHHTHTLGPGFLHSLSACSLLY